MPKKMLKHALVLNIFVPRKHVNTVVEQVVSTYYLKYQIALKQTPIVGTVIM